jgi:DNA-binding MarR family transcriptional regulator
VRGGWAERLENPESRREVLLSLTPSGRQLVSTVNRRRRKELQSILRGVPAEQRALVTEAMTIFAACAGEPTMSDLVSLAL